MISYILVPHTLAPGEPGPPAALKAGLQFSINEKDQTLELIRVYFTDCKILRTKALVTFNFLFLPKIVTILLLLIFSFSQCSFEKNVLIKTTQTQTNKISEYNYGNLIRRL